MKEILKTQILETLPENLLSRFFKALSEPTRIKIVQILLEGEHNVSDLMEILGIPQASVSNHLGYLKWYGFVIPRRNGKNTYYQILDKRISNVLKLATEVIADNAEHIYLCMHSKQRFGTRRNVRSLNTNGRD